MKKLIISIILLLVLVMVPAANAEVVFHNANQATVAWDAVTSDIDGDPISGVTYRIYLASETDPMKSDPFVAVDNITNLSATITLTKGRFFVGIQAVCEDLVSEINWGDEIEHQADVELFGLRYATLPGAPKNLMKRTVIPE